MSKSKEAEAASAICNYLVAQNRPYSATDVFNNLHKAHGKTVVQKTLEELAQKGKIRSKLYGKQVVYVADQSAYPEVPDAELKAMDLKITQLTAELKDSQAAYRQSESVLRNLNSSIKTEDAKAEIQELSVEVKRLENKLVELKSNSNSVSPEERQTIIKSRTENVKQWRKRKRMCNDILNAILEGYPKPKKELYEAIGLETDEEYMVNPPET